MIKVKINQNNDLRICENWLRFYISRGNKDKAKHYWRLLQTVLCI